MTIEATAPNRIDLAGGTLDLYPLYLFEEYGVTVNMAIDLGSYVRLETRDDSQIHMYSEDRGASQSASNLQELQLGTELDLLARIVRFYRPKVGLNITTRNKAPKGSGLGSSSSLLIALSGALCTMNTGSMPGEEIIDYGAQLEAQNLRVPTGKQDYYAALYGGVSAIWFKVEGNRREPLVASEELLGELEKRMVLSFTGESRFSGTSNWNMMKMYIEDAGTTVQSMRAIKNTALALRECLLEGDLDHFPLLVQQEWENRKGLAEGVTTERIEKIITSATRAGALANKICGAGGGGCMITCVLPEDRPTVENALREAGATVLSYSISRKGLEIKTM